MFKTNDRCADMDMEYPNQMSMAGMQCQPVIEHPCERVINRQICHHVPHIQPIHTRIVNHHVYNHSYLPEFTCCEENLETHVYDQNPCCR